LALTSKNFATHLENGFVVHSAHDVADKTREVRRARKRSPVDTNALSLVEIGLGVLFGDALGVTRPDESVKDVRAGRQGYVGR
jgi:hypothetical protein